MACSSKGDDDDNKGNGTGGTGTGGGAGKGTGGTSATGGTGGSTTGGTGGSTTGGTGGTGGSTTGGGAGTGTGGSNGGMGAGGMAGATGFACAMSPATCNLIHTWTFGTTSQWQGTYTYQETTVMKDSTTDPTMLHITGTVSKYDGFGIYTGKCSSLSGYTGITFTLKGTTSSVDKPNALKFVIQINADEPIDMTNSKGACVGSSGVECISPSKAIMPSDSPQTIMFSDLAGGKPLATVDATQVLGLQWQIDPDASGTAFPIDLTLSEVTLIGTPTGDCSSGGGGMGGMGGAAGSATGGQAGTATGGQAGTATGGQSGGGQGGVSGGRGGQGGASGGRGGAGNGGRGGA
ncbi:MAG TPA: hypothetical protein VGQ57_06690 [Polyangiaceae bacterium]|nr:hypothetical protein [Polyangiaceae bacterium]